MISNTLTFLRLSVCTLNNKVLEILSVLFKRQTAHMSLKLKLLVHTLSVYREGCKAESFIMQDRASDCQILYLQLTRLCQIWLTKAQKIQHSAMH